MAVKAPFNYIGNKYRVIESLQKFFPKRILTFVDLFCGGCDVCINTKAKTIYANDINYHIIEIFQEFQRHDIAYLLAYIHRTITDWNLTKENQAGYEAFRTHYNQTRNPLDLYVLMCFSFNYQFRFNEAHEYNNPFGRSRSSFNAVMENNLILFRERIESIQFSSLDFRNYDYQILKPGDFLYADPPYLLTCGSYNDGKRGFKGWSEQDDLDLFEILTNLSNHGIKFALSNVVEHKGKKHQSLLEWAKKNGYHKHKIKRNYDNCNYQTKNRENVTKEILVTNY